MKKNITVLMTVASILIVLGATLFLITACSASSDSSGLFGSKGVETATDVTDDFNKIKIVTDTADISFVQTNDGGCKVVANDKKNIKYSVTVEDGILKINSADELRWYERIFNFTKASLTVYLPESEYDSLTIDEHTGNISVPSYFKFATTDIKLSTGDVNYYAKTLESLTVKASTGNVTIEGENAGTVNAETSTGDIILNGAVCEGDINANVSTGDVIIANSTCKNLNSHGDTGDIKLENVTVAENVQIERSTGKTELINASCANFDTDADTGSLYMTNVIASGSFTIKRSTGDVRFDGCDARDVYVTTDTGSVKGTLLTEKLFNPRSDTGEIDTPKPSGTGACDITTDTGDIIISIKQQ